MVPIFISVQRNESEQYFAGWQTTTRENVWILHLCPFHHRLSLASVRFVYFMAFYNGLIKSLWIPEDAQLQHTCPASLLISMMKYDLQPTRLWSRSRARDVKRRAKQIQKLLNRTDINILLLFSDDNPFARIKYGRSRMDPIHWSLRTGPHFVTIHLHTLEHSNKAKRNYIRSIDKK